MEKIIRLKNVHHDLIWGCEDWIISAHKNGESIIDGGEFDGQSLSSLFNTNREVFGNIEGSEFPLLVKIIDAKTALSIQVHPGDEYAQKNESSLGKTECWYILDCADDSDIIVGQKANNREEFQKAIDDGTVMDIMQVMPANVGGFFHIPAGTVHAIRDNTKILEIQQSSDVTYRLYDYDRKDKDGNLRELHVDKSLDVINYDYKHGANNFITTKYDGYVVEKLVASRYFDVEKVTINNDCIIKNNESFILGVALGGVINVNGTLIENESSFIIPNGVDLNVVGSGQLMLSYVAR